MGPAEERPDEQRADDPAHSTPTGPDETVNEESRPPKKATAKKATAKKDAPKAATRKTASKRAASKKAAPKTATTKKAAPKKAAPKKAAPKKAAPEKASVPKATTATELPAETPAPEHVETPAEPAPPAPKPRRRGGRFRRPEIVSQPTTSPIPKVPSRDPRRLQQRVAVVIPAKDEARRIAATVRSAKSIPQVDLVLVVDDGSEDNTQHVARDAGAVVVRHSHNRGKAAAMETGAAVVAMRDTPERPPRLLLFIDGDLGETAVNTAPLIPPVAEHAADFSIALLPPQVGAGGRGMVVNAARKGIARLTGWAPTQPLSGMRCLTRAAFEAATPLARGWGVETGMTIDLLRQGYVAVEVPCDLRHRPSGKDLGGQLHRAAQYRDVQLALSARKVRSAAQSLKQAVAPGSVR